MKKATIILIFFITLNIFSNEKNLYFFCGINYYEEAHLVIALTQISPIFIFNLTIEQKFKSFSLKHNIYSHLNIFSIYLKNGFIYWTDKTINLDIPIQYNVIFNFKIVKYLSLWCGMGILFKFKYNRYSSGLNYWQSEFKYGIMPMFLIGIDIKFNKYKFLIGEQVSIIPSFIFQYKKEEYYTYFAITNFYNNLRFEFYYYFRKNWCIIFNYNNFLDLYLDINTLFGFVNFNNSFTIGVGYEF